MSADLNFNFGVQIPDVSFMPIKFESVDARRAYYKAWYGRNKHRKDFKAKIRRADTKRRQEIADVVAAIKSKLKCERCGFSHPAALDFHHCKGKKIDHVSDMVRRGASLEKVIQEIEKCEVICSNCHRIEHFNQRSRSVAEARRPV